MYVSICGNGMRIATIAASTAMFIQGLGSSVNCIAHHHERGLIAYCEGFSARTPPRVFVLQFNDQLLSTANLACLAVLQSRAEDNSLVGLKFSHDGTHLIALTAVGSSSVLVWNLASKSIVAASEFEGIQSSIAVLPAPSALKFATYGSCVADIWSLNVDGDAACLTKQSVDVSQLADGDYITCASWISRYCLVVGLQSGNVSVMDAQTLVLRSRCATPQEVGASISCLATSANHVIIGCSDGSIRFLFHEGARAHTETTPFATGYTLPRQHIKPMTTRALTLLFFLQILSPRDRKRCFGCEPVAVPGQHAGCVRRRASFGRGHTVRPPPLG